MAKKDTTRRRILLALRTRPNQTWNAASVASTVGITVENASYHLNRMSREGLVVRVRRGTFASATGTAAAREEAVVTEAQEEPTNSASVYSTDPDPAELTAQLWSIALDTQVTPDQVGILLRLQEWSQAHG